MTGSTGLAQYFKSSSSYSNQYGDAGSIRLIRSQDTNNNKYYWQIYAPIMLSTSYSDDDGDGVYNSKYAFCVSIYPTSSNTSTVIDMWENYASWFGTDLNLSSSSYNYCKGNDECSVSDNACYSKVISVGAYVTKNQITDYAGTSHDFSSEYPNIGDHAYFSSWQTAGYGPLGTALPHINAPGARIVAGINHYHTASVDDYSYYGDDYKTDLVVNSTSYPYAAMEGTSMATPCVSGIIAQWLQACVEAGKTPTPDYIKEVMAATWDTDEWTNGTGSGAHGAKTFGTHGKINAIKGIQYILGANSSPTIKVSTEEVALTGYVGDTFTETVTVTGVNLEAGVTAKLSGDSSFSIDKTSITQSAATDGADITITWKPTTQGEKTATLTLSSTDAEDVVVTIKGTVVVPELIADPETVSLTCEAGLTAAGSFSVLGANLKDNVTATLSDASGVFSLSTTTVTKADAKEGKAIDVTFAPTTVGSYTATVTLATPGTDNIVVTLNGTATTPVPTLAVSEQALTFSTGINTPDQKTITLSGRALNGDITVSLADNAGVFTVSPTTISASEIANNPTVTVTFQAAEDNSYTGSLTISSEGVDDITISLSATASDGGTASDSYLNIAKYQTIDEAGWNTTYVNTLYKYTEYEDDGVAWLTMPVYGAWSSIYYTTPKAQNWINTNITNTNNKYAGTTWGNKDELLGNTPYFTGSSGNGAARALGYNSRNNYTQETVSFYVTNTTAVKLLGLGQSRSSSYYPATLKVYECKKNADGTLTEGTTAVKSQSNSATSGTFVLSATDLDATKVYKVEAATYRSYICEIGFQTPLKKTLLGDVDRSGVVNIADVKALVKIVLGKATDEDGYDYDAADVNADTSITIADVTKLVNLILAK